MSVRQDPSPDSPPARPLLLVEEDDGTRQLLGRVLEGGGWEVDAVASARAGKERLRRDALRAAVVSLVPGDDASLELVGSAAGRLPVVGIAPSGAVRPAVEAVKRGASECLERPLSAERLLSVLADLPGSDRVALDDTGVGGLPEAIVGRSEALARTARLVRRVAPTRSTVLVTGETGTGKELVARAVHDLSPRADGPFVPVVCSALPETLLESELFGHRKGSFTGAHADREGVVRTAEGGTLFLDEISTLSQDVQVKLLRVLERGEIRPVGGGSTESVDFRLVAATNEPLESKVDAGDFREDLYYRLSVFPVRVPPLRERPEDIPLLAEHFRRRFGEENDVVPPRIPEETLARMMEYEWPGNVRELEHFVERSLILYAGEPAIRFHAPPRAADGWEQGLLDLAAREKWDLDRLEREYILRVLEEAGGNRSRAAEILGVHRRTIARKMKRYPGTGGEPMRRPERRRSGEGRSGGEGGGSG